MEMNKKNISTFMFSALGIVAMAVIMITLNSIARISNVRCDLSSEKLYTLSPGTRAILKKMDTPVTLRFYYTRDAAQMPVFLKTYAGRVEDLLKEYRMAANGKVKVQILNPSPDSDAEDSANLAGVTGQPLQGGESVYLGIAVDCLDQVVAIPFLSPERENLLEYDITRAIYRVLHPEKPVIGLMSSLPVMGQMNPMMMQMGGGRGEPPWAFVAELKRDFDVRYVPVQADSIPDDIKTLLVVHPRDLSDKTLYAIDQFVLKGGKLVAFVDPMSMIEAKMNPPNPMMGRQPQPGASTLGKLFDAWGIQFDTEKVVADVVYTTQVQGRDGNPEKMPVLVSLNREGMDQTDPVSTKLDSVLMAMGGCFTGNGADGLKKTVLLSSSEDSQMVEKFMAQMGGAAILRDFKSDGQKKALAIRLTGKFKTAFPAGAPEADAKGADKKDEPAAEPKDAAKPGIKESEKNGAVVLLGDSDMLYDNFCVRVQNLFGQKFTVPLNDNLNLLQNLMEHMSGDENLISIRSRGAVNRPFLVVARMQADAEAKFQDRIRSLENNLSEAQRKISEQQRQKSSDQKFILSPDQKLAIEKFRKEEANARKDLKQVRKELRREVDSLENRIKWANIVLMPCLVGISGIVLGLARKRRVK